MGCAQAGDWRRGRVNQEGRIQGTILDRASHWLRGAKVGRAEGHGGERSRLRRITWDGGRGIRRSIEGRSRSHAGRRAGSSVHCGRRRRYADRKKGGGGKKVEGRGWP